MTTVRGRLETMLYNTTGENTHTLEQLKLRFLPMQDDTALLQVYVTKRHVHVPVRYEMRRYDMKHRNTVHNDTYFTKQLMQGTFHNHPAIS